jgi:hypothetical protein
VTSGEEEKPSGEAEKSWEIKAEEGFTLIALTVEASQYTYIRDAKNGPEAWKALKDIYEKNSRSMRINLKRQFYMTRVHQFLLISTASQIWRENSMPSECHSQIKKLQMSLYLIWTMNIQA